MYKSGIVTNNELTISGGNGTSSLQINLGYYKNTGMLRYTDYDKISGRINGLTSAFDGKLKIGANMQIASSNETLASTDIGGAATPGLAVTLAPTIPVYAKDGSWGGAIGSGTPTAITRCTCRRSINGIMHTGSRCSVTCL